MHLLASRFRSLSLVVCAVLAAVSAHAVTFTHPGLPHTAAQIDRSTQADAIRQVTTLADRLVAEVPNPVVTFDIPGYFQDPTGQQTKVRAFEADVRAAYVCALSFQLTGNTTHAAAAKRMVLSWIDTNRTITGYDGPIVMSYLGVGLLVSADLIWNTFSAEEIARIRAWAGNVFFVQAVTPEQDKHQNNHRTWGIYAGLAVAHVREDAALFAGQVARWKSHVTAMIATDGGMPLELARGDRAGWYTYFALAPMLAAAQVIQNTSGEQLWDYNNRAMERALNYLYSNFANPDRLGAGSSCNPENLFEAMREVYPSGRWLTPGYLPTAPIDASGDQHIGWEFPTLVKATRTLATAPVTTDSGTSTPVTQTPAAPTSPASPETLALSWLTDTANRALCTVTYTAGQTQPLIELNDNSRTLAGRLNSARLLAQPGKTYDLVISARRRSGAAISVALVMRDAAGAIVDRAVLQPNLGNWTTLSVSRAAPASAATIEVALSSGASTTGATQLQSVVVRER